MLYGESDGRPAPYFYPNHIMAISFVQLSHEKKVSDDNDARRFITNSKEVKEFLNS